MRSSEETMSYRDDDLVWDALHLLFKYVIAHSKNPEHQEFRNHVARSWDRLMAERAQRNEDERSRLVAWREGN